MNLLPLPLSLKPAPCFITCWVLVLFLVHSYALAASASSKYFRPQCGNWQDDYTKLHQRIMSKEDPDGKYLISIAPPQGLADRVGGFVTHFLFALLSGRAFLHATPPGLPHLSVAYEPGSGGIETDISFYPPSVVRFDDELFNLTPAGYNYSAAAAQAPDRGRGIDRTQDYGLYLNAGVTMSPKQRIAIRKKNKRLFQFSNLNRLPAYPSAAAARRLILLGNRGFSYAIFDNPHHNETLVHRYGLSRENAFKCVFEYLWRFKMQQECSDGAGGDDEEGSRACHRLYRRMVAAQSNSDLVIGVHVRLGDGAFGRGAAGTSHEDAQKQQHQQLLAAAAPFMLCATQLKSDIKHRLQVDRVPILFLSDSHALRVAVAQHYNGGAGASGGEERDLIWTDLESTPAHTFDSLGTPQAPSSSSSPSLNEAAGRRAMAGAARDLMLFSLADYHVISPRSGFGQKAAFLNRKATRNHIYYPAEGGGSKHQKLSAYPGAVAGVAGPGADPDTEAGAADSPACSLDKPTHPRVVASTWSGV